LCDEIRNETRCNQNKKKETRRDEMDLSRKPAKQKSKGKFKGAEKKRKQKKKHTHTHTHTEREREREQKSMVSKPQSSAARPFFTSSSWTHTPLEEHGGELWPISECICRA